MGFDKGDNENIQNYMKRKLPSVSNALSNIGGIGDACLQLFGKNTIYWYDGLPDLSNKLLIGLLKQALDEHIKYHEEIEEKLRTINENETDWFFAGYEGKNILLMNNLHQHVTVNSSLFSFIKCKRKIDCSIEGEGDCFRYVKNGEILGEVPKSLLLQIVKNNIKGLPPELEEMRGVS